MRSRMELWLGRFGWLALVAGLLLSGTSAFAQQLRDELRRTIVLVENETPPSEHYWIGIQLNESFPDALRAQLELPEGQGVLVDDVMPDSPAAQAGIKKHDVIVSAGDKAVANPQDLIDAVAQAKETELSLQFLRSGKKLTVTVKPTKRPSSPGDDAVVEVPADVDAGKLQELIQQFMQQHRGGGMRMRMLQPGMVLPPGAPLPAGAHPGFVLPENLSINISRQGNQPAKISVKQDDKTWELTEDKLHELPGDIRMHVERMLGRMPMLAFGVGAPYQPPVRVEIDENTEAQPAPGQPVPTHPERQRMRVRLGPQGAAIEQRLDELNKQIRELREAIEKLQKQTGESQK